MTVQPWLLTGPRDKSDAGASTSTHADSSDGSDATAIVPSQRSRLFTTQAYPRYMYASAKTISGKGQDDAVVPQGAAVPRGRPRGQNENGHPAPAEGESHLRAIKCARPQCLA